MTLGVWGRGAEGSQQMIRACWAQVRVRLGGGESGAVLWLLL